MSLKEWIQTIGFIVLLILIGLIYLDFRKKDEAIKEYWENKSFKTDSIKVSIDYTKLKTPTFNYTVPPVKVITYQAEAPKVSINLNDSLLYVIDSLKNHIYAINTLYIKLYPDAPKLLYAQFTADSIRLDLLSTKGRVYSSRVAVNYAEFQYQYKDDNYKAEAFRKNAPKEGLHGLLFGYAGYGLVSRAPAIGADYSIYFKSFRFRADSYVTIEEKPSFNVLGSIGYKLYGR